MSSHALTIGNRRTSKHRDQTLLARFDLAASYLVDFPLDIEPFTVIAFDEWAVKNGHGGMQQVVGPDSPEWVSNVFKRNALKKEINLGGRSDLFSEDAQFQIIVNTRGGNSFASGTWKTMRLATAMELRADRLGRDVCSLVASRRVDVERMVNAMGVDKMTELQKLKTISVLQLLDDWEEDELKNDKRYNIKVSELKAVLDARPKDALPNLLEDLSNVGSRKKSKKK